MARISRKYLNTVYYHIMVQGINKEYIFKKKDMKSKYKELLIKKSKINAIDIIAYCIMDNHVHILIKAEKSEQVSKMMSQVNSSYGRFYNKLNNRVGYVFRDRYRAEPIHNQTHLQNCIKYIHENPVKANIVKECKEYMFSSYNDYVKNIIPKTTILEIYGSCSNYIEKLSGNYEEYNFIEISNEFGEKKLENFDKIKNEYRGIDFKDKTNVYKISKELKNRCNLTNDQIIEFMGLKRATYYSILKKEKS